MGDGGRSTGEGLPVGLNKIVGCLGLVWSKEHGKSSFLEARRFLFTNGFLLIVYKSSDFILFSVLDMSF